MLQNLHPRSLQWVVTAAKHGGIISLVICLRWLEKTEQNEECRFVADAISFIMPERPVSFWNSPPSKEAIEEMNKIRSFGTCLDTEMDFAEGAMREMKVLHNDYRL